MNESIHVGNKKTRHHDNPPPPFPSPPTPHPSFHTDNPDNVKEVQLYLVAVISITVVHAAVHVMNTLYLKRDTLRVINLSIFLMVSTSFYSILTSSAKAGKDHLPFHIPSSVFYTEVFKLIFMMVMNISHDGPRIFNELTHLTCRDFMVISFPAALFAIQNNLNYIALEYVDAITFQMLNTLKILFTGLASVVILKNAYLQTYA